MERDDILRMARKAGWPSMAVDNLPGTQDMSRLERFAALVAAEVHKTYSPIGTVAGGATERTFMHPSVKYVLPTGLQLYARIEVREEDEV